MQHITYVHDMPATTIAGDPIPKRDPRTGAALEGQQEHARQVDFMLGRLGDPKFIEGLSAIDGAVLILETRRALREQEESAKARGYWALEDEPAKRLKEATEKPSAERPIAQEIAHNFVDFMLAIRDMTRRPPNGAEAVEPEPEEAPPARRVKVRSKR